MKLYHFSNRVAMAGQNGDTVTLDPHARPNSFSRREYEVWSTPRTFFYTDPAVREVFFNRAECYTVDVDRKDLLDLRKTDLCPFIVSGKVCFYNLMHFAKDHDKIGFIYTVADREIVVLWDSVEARKESLK